MTLCIYSKLPMRLTFFLALFAGVSTQAPAQNQPSGPSFSCERAHSATEKMICGDVELSRLDRDLSSAFVALSAQPGTDNKALRTDEDFWLAGKRNLCSSKECLVLAYRSRIDDLNDRSLRLASPAAYDETKPFPID